jgi:phosphoglycolate phosphatase
VTLPPRPAALIFDWDNTLVETWPTIEAALNDTLVAFGHDAWTPEQVRARVRASLRDSFPALFGEEWRAAQSHFYAAFARVHLEQLCPEPGASELLVWLATSGVPLVVVSNKTGRYLRAEAEALGWAPRFHRLVGAGDASADKPSPAAVALALEGLDLSPGAPVWFIGDTGIDIACARATGCVAVLIGGHTTADERATHPPDLHLADLAALRAVLIDVTTPAPHIS